MQSFMRSVLLGLVVSLTSAAFTPLGSAVAKRDDNYRSVAYYVDWVSEPDKNIFDVQLLTAYITSRIGLDRLSMDVISNHKI